MPVPVQGPSTLYDKIYESHIVREDGDTALLYIDRHIVHEVTSPQAFEGLRAVDRKVRRPDCTLVTSDHNVPTTNRKHFKSAKTFIEEADSRQQVVTLEDNVTAFNLTYFGMNDKRQGIVHVIGPEQGFTLPGATLVCGDSHTSTHGAFGLLAFGIGTSEVEHVLATQTIIQKRAKDMRVCINGTLSEGVTSKDVILHIIGTIGTAGGTGSVIEFCGSTVEAMSMEARMSMCNMSIEAGARAGLIAPDETTFAYLRDRPLSPKGAEWDAAVKFWRTLKSDPEAKFDISVEIDGAQIEPTVSWGTSPQDVVPIGGLVPDPAKAKDANEKVAIERALEYMGLEPNTPMSEVKVDKVFIGSCTNSRIEDLRSAAKIVAGRHIASHVYAMIVPGSGLVKDQAEQEGLDTIFKSAGFDWREAGCSMCLGMNPDMLSPKERCASTSNRNFQNRQGPQGRTHLMSPAMATAAAITGHLTDVRKLSMGREKVAAPAPRSTSIEPSSIKADAKPEPTAERPDVVTDAPAQSAGGPKGGVAAPTVPAGLPKFEIYKGLAAPIDRANVDTDLIIQARHLKTIKRTGLGQYLFEALRFDRATGDPVPEFFMNQSKYDQAKILVVNGPNFGCGSSREHAGWSLLDHGIRCVIATSFGDIFSNNYMKNGCVAIQLDEATVAELYADAKACRELEIDLPKQVVRRDNGEAIPFKIDPFRKQCLIEGWDDVSLTLKHDADISAYEKRRKDVWPWLEGIGSGGRIPVRSAPLGSTEW